MKVGQDVRFAAENTPAVRSSPCWERKSKMSGLYNDILQRHLERFEEALPGYLPKEEGPAASAARAMAYACEAGGKRLRPVLTLEFCRLTCSEAQRALPFAAAVELVHSYSLVHDDLPCMDDSPLRRGKPSVHAAFGEDMALLAGDGLLTLAFEIMLNPKTRGSISAENVLAAAFALAHNAGYSGMVGGQVIDLQSEGKLVDLPVLEALQEGKTAALILAACEMGCRAGGGNEAQIAAAQAYGRNLGLCFQIVDDILDVSASAEELGKPVGSDASHEKVTYVSLLGLDEARRLAQRRTQDAVEALEPFGPTADGLRELARALLRRQR